MSGSKGGRAGRFAPAAEARHAFERTHRPIGCLGLVIGVAALMVVPVWAVTEPTSARGTWPSAGDAGSGTAVPPAAQLCPDALTFQESGLPSGASWSVGLGKNASGCSISGTSSDSSITLDEAPGTYPYALANVSDAGAQFVPVPRNGSVAVHAATVTVSISFARAYTVTFSETGLGPGAGWSAWLAGPNDFNTSIYSQGSSANFTDVPNGTYTFGLDAFGYTATPESGTLMVAGASVTEPIDFAGEPGTYAVQFSQTGLRPAGATWAVELFGADSATTETSTGATVSFRAPNGSYSYTIGVDSETIGNLNPYPSSGDLNISGSDVVVVVWIRPSYSATFTETGLASSGCLATDWAVTLNGSTVDSYGSSLTFSNLANGSYEFNVSVTACSVSPLSGVVNISGEDAGVAIVLGAPTGTQAVQFLETGLPAGTEWVVYVRDAGSYGSTNGSVDFEEPNGTYNYTLSSYNPDWGAPQGSFSVDGGPVTVTVVFRLVNTIMFTETGLPVATTWWANLTTTNLTSNASGNETGWAGYSSGGSGSSLEIIDIPNGTYQYTFGVGRAGYTATPASGTLVLTGSPVNVSVSFGPSSQGGYSVTFEESGLATGTGWSVALSGAGDLNLDGSGNGTAQVVFDDVPNGTYQFTVAATGYTAAPASGTLTVAGGPVDQLVSFSPANGTYRVTFNESGLSSGTSWGVELATSSNHSANSTNSSAFTSTEVSRQSSIAFSVVNGTYSFSVGGGNLTVERYTPSPSSGTVVVSGSNVNVAIAMSRSGAPSSVAVGSAPFGLAYASGQGEVFVANECGDAADGNLSVINDSRDQVVAWVNVGGVGCGSEAPWTMAYDPVQGEVFVADFGANNVTVISAVSNSVVATIPVGLWPSSIAYDSGTNQLFVTNLDDNNVSVISAASNTVVATVAVGPQPQAVACDPATHRVFVFNDPGRDPAGSTVSVISDVTDEVVDTISAPGVNDAAVYDAGTGQVFYAGARVDGSNDAVGVLSAVTDSVVGTVPVGSYPDAIAYDPASGTLYVANYGSDNVSAISDNTEGVVATLPVGSEPSAVVFDSGTSQLFVANSNDSNVTVIPIAAPTGVNVTFSESGLAPKALSAHGWSVVLDGVRERSRTSQMTFLAALGSQPLLVTGPSGYATGRSGTINVSASTVIPVVFSAAKTLTLTIQRSGLPKNQTWCVALDGAETCSTRSALTFANLSAGTYVYALRRPLQGQSIVGREGATEIPTLGNLSLARSETLRFAFVYAYHETFLEAGHPNGTWSITVKGHTESNATGDPIVFDLPNGTYSYKVGSVAGFKDAGSPARAKVDGAAAIVNVTFTSKGGRGDGPPDAPPVSVPQVVVLIERALILGRASRA